MSFGEQMYELEIAKKTKGIMLCDMNLSVRLYNCLRRAGYSTLSEIMLASPSTFREIRNLGKMSEEELYSLLAYVRVATRDELIRLINLNKSYLGSDRIITSDFDRTVLEVALKQKLNVGSILFKNDNGDLVDDICLREVSFSSRTHKFFAKEGMCSLRAIVNMQYGELVKMQGLGEKSLSEIMMFVSERVTSIYIDEEIRKKLTSLTDRVVDYYSSILVGIDLKSAHLQLYNAFIGLCLGDETVETLEDKEMPFFVFCKPFKTYITNQICNDASDSILIGTDIDFLCYSYGINEKGMKRAFCLLVNSLNDEKKIRLIGGKLYKYKLFLHEWIESLDGNYKLALIGRCEGKTLEEVGNELELTRERIRQMISKILRCRPALYEEDYAEIIEKYSFTEKQFADLFGISIFQVNFIRLNHKKGTGDIQEFLFDATIPEMYKEKVERVFRDKMVLINGECVPLKRDILLEKLLKTFFSDEECTLDEFELFYHDFLKENGLEGNENLLFPSSRAFEARIIDYPYSIYKYGRKLRYYDTTALNINDLLQQVNIQQYDNMEISTRKVFKDYPEVMELYDIRDEYELHNILRKRRNNISCFSINITRMPFITIGHANRFQQVEELLFQTAPISNYDLALLYEERYGVQRETVLSNFFTSIDIYFHDGIFDLEQQDLSEEEFALMQEAMTDDIYLWSDVIELYKKVVCSEKNDVMNAMIVKKLGYKIYSQYVISNRYSSADAYITYLLTRNPRYDLNEIDVGIRRLQIFYSVFVNLRDKLDIIEIDKDIFVTFDYFQSHYRCISKNDIKELGMQIIAGQGAYFSVNALANSGLCNFNLGVANNVYFLNSIIRIQDGIKTAKMGNVFIASRGGELSHLGIISYVANCHDKISVYDLLAILRNSYGLILEKSRVIYVLGEAFNLYYDGVFEIISKGESVECGSAEEFWNSGRAAELVDDKRAYIFDSDTSIVQVFWKDKYALFVDYCGNHSYTLMRELLNINFDLLYRKANDYNLSRNLISEVMTEFINWINKISYKAEKENNTSILDLFFK